MELTIFVKFIVTNVTFILDIDTVNLKDFNFIYSIFRLLNYIKKFLFFLTFSKYFVLFLIRFLNLSISDV